MNKATIHWVCDRPGWAFDAIARLMAENQPQYEHQFHYVGPGIIGKMEKVGLSDIIVCTYPPYVVLVKDLKNVVVCTSGYRFMELTKDDKDTFYRKLSEMELESKNGRVTPVSTGKIRTGSNAPGFRSRGSGRATGLLRPSVSTKRGHNKSDINKQT